MVPSDHDTRWRLLKQDHSPIKEQDARNLFFFMIIFKVAAMSGMTRVFTMLLSVSLARSRISATYFN
jgi:hypothetical protein